MATNKQQAQTKPKISATTMASEAPCKTFALVWRSSTITLKQGVVQVGSAQLGVSPGDLKPQHL